MVTFYSRYIYAVWGLEQQRGGGKSHKGWATVFMGAGVDPSKHHDLATLPELYLLILLFQSLFHL